MKDTSSKTPYDYYSHQQLRKKPEAQKTGWVEAEDNSDTMHGVIFRDNENETVEEVWNGSSSDV